MAFGHQSRSYSPCLSTRITLTSRPPVPPSPPGLTTDRCRLLSGVRDNALQPKLYVGLVLVLIFAEALGLYGLIIGLILASKEENEICLL